MEERLWTRLRDNRLGFKFRRQHPISDFVLDFYCEDARLAVEIDGPTHARQAKYDQWRNEQLEALGIVTLRLTLIGLPEDLTQVAEQIKAVCAGRVLPHP